MLIPIKLILSFIALSIVLILPVLLIQYLRGVLFKHRYTNTATYLFLSLIGIEYLLSFYLICLFRTDPYQIDTYVGWHQENNSYSLGLKTRIYILFIIDFILICITSFKHTAPYYKTNTKKYLYLFLSLFVVSYLIIYLLFNNSKPINLAMGNHSQFILTIFLLMYITIPVLFLSTMFHIDRKLNYKTILYTIIPLVLFYTLYLAIQIQFTSLTPKEIEELEPSHGLNRHGELVPNKKYQNGNLATYNVSVLE